MDTLLKYLDVLKIIAMTAAIVVAIIVLYSCREFARESARSIPNPPVLINTLDSTIQANQEMLLKNYDCLSVTIQEQRTRIFDKVVTNTIMPSFTTLIAAIIGFVFAKGVGVALKNYVDRKPGR